MENEKHEKELKGGKTKTELYIQLGIIAILVLVIVFTIGKISSPSMGLATGVGTVSALDVTPIGTPEVYGEELQVSYNDVSTNNLELAELTIQKLSSYEDAKLNPALMERYIKIGSNFASS